MIGRRLPTPVMAGPDDAPSEKRWQPYPCEYMGNLEHPGDYCGPIINHYYEGRPHVWYLRPDLSQAEIDAADCMYDLVNVVAGPPHSFRECGDGSLEVRPSILGSLGRAQFHGYLDEGHSWRIV